MSKLSEYFGEGEFDGRWAYVHALSYNKYAAQAVTDGGHTEFRLGEFSTEEQAEICLLYTSPSPRDGLLSRMPSSA